MSLAGGHTAKACRGLEPGAAAVRAHLRYHKLTPILLFNQYTWCGVMWPYLGSLPSILSRPILSMSSGEDVAWQQPRCSGNCRPRRHSCHYWLITVSLLTGWKTVQTAD